MSSKELTEGDILAIITVRQLPPKESFKSLVSLLPLYGTNMFFELLSVASLNAWIQLPRISKD